MIIKRYFMSLPKPVILLSMITFLLHRTALAQPDFVRTRCMTTSGNYSANSTYTQALNLVLTTLINQSSSSMSAYTQTLTPDKAYGLFYCRGDLDISTCTTCVQTASKKLVSDCPDDKDGVVWYEQCTLRYYANDSAAFLGDDGKAVGERSGDSLPDPNQFFIVLTLAMSQLINETAYGVSSPGYATGEVNVTSLQTLHCLTQCSPFIASGRCDECLKGLLNEVVSSYSNRTGVLLLNPSCQVRYDFLPFYKIASTNLSAHSPGLSPTFSPVYHKAPPTLTRGKNSMYYVIRVAIPAACLALLLASIFLCLRRRLLALINGNSGQEEGEYIKEGSAASSFSFQAMKKATDNFSDKNKLGQGGFGAVYKGLLDSGEEVATKRLSEKSGQGNKEFSTEVIFVAKLQHRNLVRLLGYCQEKKERLLVYEFLPNLSLDKFLFDPSESRKLDWRARYNIIVGIARGLQYLHHESRLNIIHRDLKTSNILLDKDMNPKIADFGLAKLIELDHTHGDTTKIAGTMGYMAPEYIILGQFSTKSDVYSFGAILLEIISGRMVYKQSQSENHEGLIQLIRRLWEEGKPEEVLDASMEYYDLTEVIRCINIGLLCVEYDALSRPPMQMVLVYLNSNLVSIPAPVFPSSPSLNKFITSSITNSAGNTIFQEENQLLNSSITESFSTQTSGTDLYPR